MSVGKSPKKSSRTALGVELTRDVSASVDWVNLSVNVLEFFSKTILAAATIGNVASGTGNLISAAKSLKADMQPGEKAWHVAMLSFGWALSEIAVVSQDNVSSISSAIKVMLKKAGERVDSGEELAPYDFITRPTSLPLYGFLRNETVKNKLVFRAGVTESDDTFSAKLDAAYDRAMFEIFLRRPDLFDVLSSVASSGAIAPAQKQMDWSAYRHRLVYEFNVKPVFGQEYSRLSLGQLYIPLRGYWRKNDELPLDIQLDHLSDHYDYGWIESLLESWISHNSDDWIRLVGGGPGSGKSTTLRALASKLAARADFRRLFIPLQHISLDGDLRDAINRHFSERTGGDFHHPPLARSYVEDGPPLVLIFDGLDEIARPGEAANEVVGLFAAKLANLVAALKGDGQQNLRVIVSGRMPAFQAAKRYLAPPKEGCIEVYGYTPIPGQNAEHVCEKDQRKDWWIQYASLTGLPRSIPPAFSSEKLSGLTHEPLLCYLLVLSGFALANWEKAAENPNIIYRQLVDSIWDRGWGEGAVKRQGAGRTLSKHDFNILMQTIAIAAWQGGDTRVASEEGFEAAIGVARAGLAWDAFKRDNGSDVTNLAMNFYLKSSEDGHRGFEFTHKSFGDYLAARAVLDIALDLPSVVSRRVDHAMAEWVEATSTGVLTGEILQFLRDEVRLRISESSTVEFVKVKSAFEKLIDTALEEGMPVQNGGHTWRAAEQRQANAESAAWAVVNAISLALAGVGDPNCKVEIDWPNPKESFQALIKRLTRGGLKDSPVLKCFSYVIAPESFLFGMAISSIDLRGAEMPGSNFNGCHLLNANLEGGKFAECTFERAMLDSANMMGGDFTNCRFADARLTHSKIAGAKFDGSTISPVTLLHSSLEGLQELLPAFSSTRNSGGEMEERFWEKVSEARRVWEMLNHASPARPRPSPPPPRRRP